MFSFQEKPVRHLQVHFLIKTGGFYAMRSFFKSKFLCLFNFWCTQFFNILRRKPSLLLEFCFGQFVALTTEQYNIPHYFIFFIAFLHMKPHFASFTFSSFTKFSNLLFLNKWGNFHGDVLSCKSFFFTNFFF